MFEIIFIIVWVIIVVVPFVGFFASCFVGTQHRIVNHSVDSEWTTDDTFLSLDLETQRSINNTMGIRDWTKPYREELYKKRGHRWSI